MEFGKLFKKLFLNKRKSIKIGTYSLPLCLDNRHERQYLKNFQTTDYFIAEKLISEHDRVLDIGANIGLTSIFYLHHGASKVDAVEPLKVLSNRIKMLRINEINVFNFGLSDSEGLQEIFISTEHNQGHSLNPDWPKRFSSVFTSEKKEKVIVTTLDKSFKNELYDFIKIDVEGVENKLIMGGRKFFENNRNAIIQIEIYKFQFVEVHQLLKEFYINTYVTTLSDEGLQIYKFSNEEELINFEFKGAPNYLYSNKDIHNDKKIV